MAEIDKRVGQRIRRYREAAGLTQAELGDILQWGDRAQTRISHYEVGRRAVGISDLKEIAAALRVSVDDLVDGKTVGAVDAGEPIARGDRKALVRLYNSLGEARRASVLEYMRQLQMDEDEERARMSADLHHIAKLSTPRVSELIEALARAVVEHAISDDDALVIKQMLTSLTRRNQDVS